MALLIRSLCRSMKQPHKQGLSVFRGVVEGRRFAGLTSTSDDGYNFETLAISKPREFVIQVDINRPEKRNAMNLKFWSEMVECFDKLAVDEDCRTVVLSGNGAMFTAGMDLQDFAQLLMKRREETSDPGRQAFALNRLIPKLQDSFTAIERCPKPVIAAVHSACIGGGVDMVSACDIRICTTDAWFQIKEVDLGIAADVGTLQRFPKVIGNDSLVRELVYTARKFLSDEAKECGFVSRVFKNKETMVENAIELAATIAEKSPMAVQGSKKCLVYSRDHSVGEGLEYMNLWNQSMLQSEDMLTAVQSMMEKKKPVFKKL
ncbi:delta(3,5)-Delta(2,4)-dienoyl-CoA isomerase, mitochondrial-like [Tubulanus polymorphus]|uniref:delta(3,5)-Delta(2,4)-dienoyl-CoA isomerase, mitochondrial-like n=1 Tax=Tubulanus polymorphus TaxID=672921 RepID=UPI003DA3ACCC